MYKLSDPKKKHHVLVFFLLKRKKKHTQLSRKKKQWLSLGVKKNCYFAYGEMPYEESKIVYFSNQGCNFTNSTTLILELIKLQLRLRSRLTTPIRTVKKYDKLQMEYYKVLDYIKNKPDI